MTRSAVPADALMRARLYALSGPSDAMIMQGAPGSKGSAGVAAQPAAPLGVVAPPPPPVGPPPRLPHDR